MQVCTGSMSSLPLVELLAVPLPRSWCVSRSTLSTLSVLLSVGEWDSAGDWRLVVDSALERGRDSARGARDAISTATVSVASTSSISISSQLVGLVNLLSLDSVFDAFLHIIAVFM